MAIDPVRFVSHESWKDLILTLESDLFQLFVPPLKLDFTES